MMFSANASRFFLVLAAACNAVSSAVMPDIVDIGKAGEYTILAKSGISNVAPSRIQGNIAVSPITGTSMTGFDLILETEGRYSTSDQFEGKAYAANYVAPTPATLTTAVSNMEAAYTDAAGRAGDGDKLNLGSGKLGEYVGSSDNKLTAGVYTFGTSDVTIKENIYFSGDAKSVFIIRMTGNLRQMTDTSVILGEVKAENIFWQIAGNVVVEEGASMAGVLLVKTDVLFMTGSFLEGRVLSQTAVNLQETVIMYDHTR
jgi:hypothetical protein